MAGLVTNAGRARFCNSVTRKSEGEKKKEGEKKNLRRKKEKKRGP
jgi:hypothetical protein